jgi:biotin carboxyl carrier protein
MQARSGLPTLIAKNGICSTGFAAMSISKIRQTDSRTRCLTKKDMLEPICKILTVSMIFLCAGTVIAQTDRSASIANHRSISHSTTENSNSVEVQHCVVFAIEDIDVPARTSGQLAQMHVREGQLVEKDHLLAQVDDRLAQLSLQAAKDKIIAIELRAEDDSKVRLANASLKVFQVELERTRTLARTQSVSQQDLRRAEFREEEARITVESANHDRNVLQKELNYEKQNVAIAEAQAERFTIKSPTKGTVKKLYLSAGEWVKEGDKVLQVVRMDKLWVEGFVSAEQYDPYEVDGRPVTVIAQLANQKTEMFEGKLIFVGLEKSVSGRYVVRAEISNRFAGDGSHWLLMPGSSVQMKIDLR